MREDWTTRGPFAGRGPKGYERSDERIREDVCDLLCEHGALDASSVEVQVQGREVTLLGFVPSRLQKRLAEDLADSVSGVHEVHNQLRVSQTATAGEPGQPGQTDRRDRAA
jgi:osmotically-inducible protein OsmY